MVPGYEYLTTTRLGRVMQALEDKRDLPQELKFVNRTPMSPAMEGEIIGRNINRVQIADLVSDDAKALTYSAGKIQLENTPVPNIKHGKHLTQENLNQLSAIAANPNINYGGAGNNEIFGNFLPSMMDDLRLGIYQRIEALIVAMHLDGVTYDRFGMKVTGNWGIPADLKVTPSYGWNDPVNATPVNDIWNLKRQAAVRYGESYDRVTMSTSAFMYMIATTEFQNKARTTIPLTINFANVPQANLMFQQNIATNILGLEVELYDARFWSQAADGSTASAPYLPINKVILTNKSNDNNPGVQDFANGVVTESIVSGFLPNGGTGGVIGRIPAGARGPVAYVSVPPDLNAPNLTMWAVSRGFPRRFRLQASALLTVGTFGDTIAVGEPF